MIAALPSIRPTMRALSGSDLPIAYSLWLRWPRRSRAVADNPQNASVPVQDAPMGRDASAPPPTVKSSDQLVTIVQQLKKAIQEAQLRTPDITVATAQIQLKTTLSGGPGVDFSFHALEISGNYTHSEIQTLTISLTPHPATIEIMAPVADQLVEAIASISSAAREAAVSEPRFDLQGATIDLNVGIDKEGKAMIVIGGSAASSNYHTLTLTVKSK
jgi:hypothetical protein